MKFKSTLQMDSMGKRGRIRNRTGSCADCARCARK